MVDLPLELQPGALAVQKSRVLPDGGLVEFEYAPAGFTRPTGERRKIDYRRYWFTPAGGTKRHQLTSVTSITDYVIPKQLTMYGEREGVFGAIAALNRGLIRAETDPKDAVRLIRIHKLGVDAHRDRAADRGLNVHSVLEDFMNGHMPNPGVYPFEHRPFIKGLGQWLMSARPQAVEVELITADPEQGYAGRIDLIAWIDRKLTLVDLKTQPDGKTYDSAQFQVGLYRYAEEKLGKYRFDGARIVVVDDTGGPPREEPVVTSREDVEAMLDFYRRLKPISVQCERKNEERWRELRDRSAA